MRLSGSAGERLLDACRSCGQARGEVAWKVPGQDRGSRRGRPVLSSSRASGRAVVGVTASLGAFVGAGDAAASATHEVPSRARFGGHRCAWVSSGWDRWNSAAVPHTRCGAPGKI